MTEITRVPLQPIAKGSLVKLWIAIALAVLIGAAVAWSAMPKGVTVDTLQAGTGGSPAADDVVFVKYVGKLADGTVFDESQEVPLPVEGVFPEGNPLPLERMIPGFREGAMQMSKGGKYVINIPASEGYGDQAETNPQTGEEVIPANSNLTFEVELIDFMSMADFEQRLQALQQMMQMQQGAPGTENVPAPAPAPPQ